MKFIRLKKKDLSEVLIDTSEIKTIVADVNGITIDLSGGSHWIWVGNATLDRIVNFLEDVHRPYLPITVLTLEDQRKYWEEELKKTN